MNARMILVAGSFGTLLASPAFAEDTSGSTSATTSKMRAEAQFELLPLGSGKTSVGDGSVSQDTAVAYGITGTFDYAVTPYISVGVAPRIVFNVISDDATDGVKSGRELDLRARVLGHYPVSPGVELYGSLSPGYTILMSGEDGVDNATGFAIGGAAGVTYDLSPKMFIGGEVGYQRAFTSSDMTVAGQTFSADLDLSYLHIGIGAGTRF